MIRLAIRNLWRQRRRSGLMIFALTVGVTGASFGDAFINGWGASMMDDARDNLPGIAQVINPDYLNDPELANGFRLSDEQLETLVGDRPYVPRIVTGGIIRSEREMRGVLVTGVNPKKELQLTVARRFSIEGEFLPAGRGIVLGAALAQRLRTAPGRRVVVMLRGIDDRMFEAGVRVVGIFNAPSRSAEMAVAYMSIEAVRDILNEPHLLTAIALYSDDDARAVDEAVPSGLRVVAWDELRPVLRVLQSYAQNAGWFIRILLFTALAFGVVNSLLASVHERTREFGLLLALGMRPGSISLQIAVEVVVMVMVALVLGGLLAVGLAALVGSISVAAYSELGMPGMSDAIRVEIRGRDFLTLIPTVLVVGLLASLLPVRRVMRLDPIAAMRRS